MTDTTANIRAKKCGNTGLTEDIAKRFADAESGHLLAIVELKVDEVHKKADGADRKVDFIVTTIEPVMDHLAEDHVRGLQRALFMNRKLHSDDEQLQLDTASDREQTVGEVVAGGAHFLADLDDEDDTDEEPEDDGDPEAEQPAAVGTSVGNPFTAVP